MRISKNRLKQIIREETKKMLSERLEVIPMMSADRFGRPRYMGTDGEEYLDVDINAPMDDPRMLHSTTPSGEPSFPVHDYTVRQPPNRR